MTDNFQSTSNCCPRCGNRSFDSNRALSIHLNSCQVLFATTTAEVLPKRTFAQLTVAQRADHILNSIKRQHISHNRPNIDRLSVNPVSSYTKSTFNTNPDTDDSGTYHDNDFGTGDDFATIDEADNTTACTDPYDFQHNLNPPPGIKFGIHLQHILSSHRGVDLKVYDEIIDLIKFHSAQDSNFSTHG